ncbi:hypothetical protein [Methylomonas sp. MgM2]
MKNNSFIYYAFGLILGAQPVVDAAEINCEPPPATAQSKISMCGGNGDDALDGGAGIDSCMGGPKKDHGMLINCE